jgi:prevent-host-death family protein
MRSVGTFEGKTHFSELVARAEQGEIIIVTRNGRPVAQIGPITPDRGAKLTAAAAVEALLASHHRLEGVTIRELIDDGRRS